MDTGTHVVMGLALGGLATIDPVVAESAITAQSVLIGTLIGSQAPDIDTVLKLKNNAVYIKNHRGITHSIPAIILWPLIITAGIYPFFLDADLLHLWIWTFIAVFLHVFVDIFNAYGTQALRPFSSKWVALGVINTFDPFIFFIHVFGLVLWVFGADPRFTFISIYVVIIVYYIMRFQYQYKVLKSVKKIVPEYVEVIVAPTIRYHEWRLAITAKEHFYVGKAFGKHIEIYDQFQRVPLPKSPIVDAALKDKNIIAFLSFSPVYRWEIDEFNEHYEVRFIDLRYRSHDRYPFVAVVQLDLNLTIISSYTGWIFSEEKLRKKLELLPD